MKTLTVRLCEQVDGTSDASGTGFRYSWLLDGCRKAQAARLPGWEWVRGVGRAGCFRTKDPDLAAATASRLGIDIVSNGTHAGHGACGLLCIPPAAPARLVAGGVTFLIR